MEKRAILNRKSLYVVAGVVLCSLILIFFEGLFLPQYTTKSAMKVGLFLLVPFSYFLFFKEEWNDFKKLFQINQKGFLLALFYGLDIYAVIVFSYFFLGNLIDFSGVVTSLTGGSGITADNFGYVAVYISFVNSFLEEFFFRGFAFVILKKHTSRRFAYLFSALMFAVYHLGMTSGWFQPGILLLTLFGLFVGGCMFNRLNEKSESIYPSWLCHMFANFAINTIGFILFDII